MASLSHLWREILKPWADTFTFPPNQVDMAKVFGVTRGTITNWKVGSSTPGPARVRRIAAVTGRPYIEVLNAVLHDSGYLVSENLG